MSRKEVMPIARNITQAHSAVETPYFAPYTKINDRDSVKKPEPRAFLLHRGWKNLTTPAAAGLSPFAGRGSRWNESTSHWKGDTGRTAWSGMTGGHSPKNNTPVTLTLSQPVGPVLTTRSTNQCNHFFSLSNNPIFSAP
jgi:hypothetical protein